MLNEEPPKFKYDFTRVVDTYAFETNGQIEYEIIFRPTPYLFGESSLYADLVYELIF